ncbi:hypothetical protein Tco_0575860 [Tanacetum coccineum]
MLFIMPSWKQVNPLYKFKWTKKNVPVQKIILTRIDNDIYSTVDACPNACKMWKAIEKLKQDYSGFYKMMKELIISQQAATRNKGKAIVNSSPPTYDQDPDMVTEDDAFRAHQDNTQRINRGTRYDNQRAVNVVGDRENVARECQKLKRAKDATYHKEKMLLCKQRSWISVAYRKVTGWVPPNDADNFGPIFDTKPLQKVQNDDNNYNVFANDREHPVQPEFVNDTYLEEQRDTNITIEPLDMSTNRETVDHDDDDLAKERDLLAFLIEKLKCEIDDSKNRNKFLESSNKILVDKLTSQIEDFKNTNKSLESSNTHFKEANNELKMTNQLMFKDLKKFQVNLIDKEIEKVIALENKVKVLDDIVYKTGQSVQPMNMINRNCKTSFVKPEFLKKAQRANPRLYDIGCYNDNLALMLTPESEETIRLAQESRSKLSDLIRPFDYKNLNNLCDLFVPQRENSS